MTSLQPLILIADDEPDALLLYKKIFERAGFRVHTVVNGDQAIDVAINEQPDIVLMDVKMPVMDGIEAQKKLSENPKTHKIPVVFLTAFGDPAILGIQEHIGGENGAVGFIKKGSSLGEIVTQVKAIFSPQEVH